MMGMKRDKKDEEDGWSRVLLIKTFFKYKLGYY